MPATSKEQKVAACIALSAKRGKTPKSKLRGASLSMYKGMSAEKLSHYCKGPIKTKRPRMSAG